MKLFLLQPRVFDFLPSLHKYIKQLCVEVCAFVPRICVLEIVNFMILKLNCFLMKIETTSNQIGRILRSERCFNRLVYNFFTLVFNILLRTGIEQGMKDLIQYLNSIWKQKKYFLFLINLVISQNKCSFLLSRMKAFGRVNFTTKMKMLI